MIKLALGLVLSFVLGGCSSLNYYSQAVGGHLEVMRAARPIDELVGDPATDPALKKQLKQVNAIRDFASRELALPDNDSYRAFADLGRPFVVWNVLAAPEFSLVPEQWCMLVVGCVSYRGFYDRAEAEEMAAELKQAGYDTYVGGVPAYSTLGFFSDPVLNTFLRYGDLEVAHLIFHELAHQIAFAEGDSVFNESFATAVENEGVRRWLARSANKEQSLAFSVQQRRQTQFAELVMSYRNRLAQLYAADGRPQAKRLAKATVLAEMKQGYANLKASWGGYSGYDKWFEQDLNNAKMASFAVYTQRVPAFEAMLAAEGGDLRRFYRRVAALAQQPREEREATLSAIAATATRLASVEPAQASGRNE